MYTRLLVEHVRREKTKELFKYSRANAEMKIPNTFVKMTSEYS